MKILKNNLTKPIKYTCDDCGSIFEFDYRDIQRREVTSLALFGDTTSKRFVICPVCAYENEFNNSKIIKEQFDKAMDVYEEYRLGKKEKEKEKKDEDVKPVDNKETIDTLNAFSRFCTKEFKDEK